MCARSCLCVYVPVGVCLDACGGQRLVLCFPQSLSTFIFETRFSVTVCSGLWLGWLATELQGSY